MNKNEERSSNSKQSLLILDTLYKGNLKVRRGIKIHYMINEAHFLKGFENFEEL